MIVSNLDHLPERSVSKTLGIVFGYASGEHIDMDDGDELFSLLFARAEKMLIANGMRMSCDAILKVDGKITRDENGEPEILLIGTAVNLNGKEDREESMPSLTMRPSNPSTEVVKMIREEKSEDRKNKKMRKDIYDLADDIGISIEKAKMLTDNGFRTMESISEANSKMLSEINGINPTQARILIKKARDLLQNERGL